MIEIVLIRLSTRSSGRREFLMSDRVVGYSRGGRYGRGSFLRAVHKGFRQSQLLKYLDYQG